MIARSLRMPGQDACLLLSRSPLWFPLTAVPRQLRPRPSTGNRKGAPTASQASMVETLLDSRGYTGWIPSEGVAGTTPGATLLPKESRVILLDADPNRLGLCFNRGRSGMALGLVSTDCTVRGQ